MNNDSIFKKNIFFVLFAIICTALWGSAFPGVKLGYEWFQISTTGDKILFAGIRFLISGIALLTIYSIKNKKFPTVEKENVKSVISLAIMQIAGNYFFYYIGLSNTAGSVASIVNSFDTFLSILLVSLFFKDDKLTLRKIIGCLIGLSGIVIVNLNGANFGSFKLLGEGFILFSSLFSSFGIIINKKVSSKVEPLLATGYHLTIGGATLTVIALSLGGRMSFTNVKADLCLAYLSMVSAVAFLIWSALLKYNDVSKTGIFKLMTPIFGNVFSAIFLGENIFTPMHIVSVILVSAGIGIVNYRKQKL